jgi:hypothetical protein
LNDEDFAARIRFPNTYFGGVGLLAPTPPFFAKLPDLLRSHYVQQARVSARRPAADAEAAGKASNRILVPQMMKLFTQNDAAELSRNHVKYPSAFPAVWNAFWRSV